MRKLAFLILVSMLSITAFAQPPQSIKNNYGSGEEDSEACYAQCLRITTDTIRYKCDSKPEWVVPEVVPGYPQKVTTTYPVKEACADCFQNSNKSLKTKTEVVLVKNAYCEYFTTNCSFAEVRDSYMIQEGYWKYLVDKPVCTKDEVTVKIEGETEKGVCIPAEKGVRYEEVLIKEACEEIEVREYEWTTDIRWQVIAPARKKWVRRLGDETCLSANPEDCLVWCEVPVPEERAKCEVNVKKDCPYGYEDNGEYCIRTTKTKPQYKTVRVETCEAPARFEKSSKKIEKSEDVRIEVCKSGEYAKTWIPPKYKYFTKKLVKEEPRLDSTCYPAVYDTIDLKLEIVKVNGGTNPTPEVTESCDLEKCVKPSVKTEKKGPEITDEFVVVYNTEPGEWVKVLCGPDVDSYTIRQIQRALLAKGYDCGPVDNVLGAQTKAALTQFQRDHGLPVGGQLDFKTLAALGLSF